MIYQISLFVSAAVISLLITFPLIRLLEILKIDQHIREEGPDSHKAKAGTPTMGGVGFITTIIVFAFIFTDFDFDLRFLGLILLTLGFGIIGLLDDLVKVFNQRNLGLTFWQKIIFQTAIASIFSFFLISNGHPAASGKILSALGFANPFLYFFFSVFVIVATANATNLTDGLNGLLAGTASIAFFAFALIASKIGNVNATSFSLAAAGAIFAFLYFNFPKARSFMGDVGSLAIGAALAGIALIIHKELLLIIIGGVFVLEALSVILQVTSFKLFKKRIFKMAPLHHHFELMGFKETSVVIGFWAVAAILGMVGVLIK